jgi:hypothetical protein
VLLRSSQQYSSMSAPNPNAAQAVIGALNKVIKYSIGLGAGATALQTSLYTGKQQHSSNSKVAAPGSCCSLTRVQDHQQCPFNLGPHVRLCCPFHMHADAPIEQLRPHATHTALFAACGVCLLSQSMEASVQ